VTASTESPDFSAPAGLKVALVWLLGGLALLTVALDQATKAIVVATMTEGQQITVIDHVFYLIFVRNPGAAFSMISGQTWIFSILAVAVTGIIVWTIRRIHSRAWAVVFGLLLGGTLGNLIDRLFREPGFGIGHVIDFLNLPWLMPAIFNVADIAISTAAVMFILLVLLGIGLDGKRSRRSNAPVTEGNRGDA
jgi:signal peptidase II